MTVSNEVGSFVSAWFRSRPSHLLQRAMATVILLAVVSVPAFMESPKRSLIARYRKAGFTALRGDKPKVAELYFKRMGRLDATDIEGRFGMAMTAEKLGNVPLAHRLMTGLAYGETPYPLAHNWLAEQILKDRSNDLSEDDFWQVRRHLEEAVADPSATVQSHALLGTMLLTRGEYHDAIPHFVQVVESRPELRIPLARAYSAINRHDEAAAEIAQALNHFRSMSLATPSDADCCLIRVQCELMAGEMMTAERVLLRARDRFPDDDRFEGVLLDMHLGACDRGLQRKDFTTALQHLDKAMAMNAQARGVVERFALIAGSKSEVADSALEVLKQAAASGKAPAATHLAIGGVLLRRDDAAGAIYHFEIGLRHNPDSIALLNNLAWCLSREKPNETQRALKLIDRAIERAGVDNKRRAQILETRGEILARAGRYSEAVVDLERSLSGLTDPSNVHMTLAKAYEQLGRQALADTHRRVRAEKMAKAPGKGARIR